MGHNPTVYSAIKATRKYWSNCKFDRLITEAKKDHRQALNEIIKVGYTWGLKHPLPFDWERLDVTEIISVRNSLFPKKNFEHNKNKKYSKNVTEI